MGDTLSGVQWVAVVVAIALVMVVNGDWWVGGDWAGWGGAEKGRGWGGVWGVVPVMMFGCRGCGYSGRGGDDGGLGGSRDASFVLWFLRRPGFRMFCLFLPPGLHCLRPGRPESISAGWI